MPNILSTWRLHLLALDPSQANEIHYIIGYLQKIQEDIPTIAGLLTLPINRLRLLARANIKEEYELPTNAVSRSSFFPYDEPPDTTALPEECDVVTGTA